MSERRPRREHSVVVKGTMEDKKHKKYSNQCSEVPVYERGRKKLGVCGHGRKAASVGHLPNAESVSRDSKRNANNETGRQCMRKTEGAAV